MSETRNPFHRPFRDLARLVGPRPANRPAPPLPRQPSEVPPGREPSDDELFRAATRDVVRLPAGSPPPAAVPPGPAPDWRGREESEALAALGDLAAGIGPFDIRDADEAVEGSVVGLDRRVVERLRRGEFTRQAHIDLHGLTTEEAREAIRQFVFRSLRAGLRSVLVVHGRGRNSPGGRPVLKEAVVGWLSRGELSRMVLAFTSARPCDGGTGALYVLLRRRRRHRKPFHVVDGS